MTEEKKSPNPPEEPLRPGEDGAPLSDAREAGDLPPEVEPGEGTASSCDDPVDDAPGAARNGDAAADGDDGAASFFAPVEREEECCGTAGCCGAGEECAFVPPAGSAAAEEGTFGAAAIVAGIGEDSGEGVAGDAAPWCEDAPGDLEGVAEEDDGAPPSAAAGEGAPGAAEGAVAPEDVLPLERLVSIVESLLLLSPHPLTLDRIGKILGGLPRPRVREVAEALKARHEADGSGIVVEEVGKALQLRTNPLNKEYVKALFEVKPVRFSRAALETLSIIAYRQPVTRQEMEEIRGVDCAGALKTLMERRLVKVAGKKDVPGKPFLFGTTREFMEVFGLPSLADLPSLREIEDYLRESAGGLVADETTEEGGTPLLFGTEDEESAEALEGFDEELAALAAAERAEEGSREGALDGDAEWEDSGDGGTEA
jgi:segregation and condensation protein B